ncbi:MAG: FKBP-type peptidyl-prolyl cis-trans isomerase [Prevotellaceae bacterium]|nr:FKBP-type peptidyl-prolyl cis-trans isomerase [Prevotellaceae bacterium]
MPQLPSNRDNAPDSTAYFLTKLNSAIITHTDSVLTEFVNKNYADFKKSPEGFWYKIFSAQKSERLNRKDSAQVRYHLYLLDNEAVKSETFIARFGKKEMTTGLESGLLLLAGGDSAVFVVPYYLAFGAKGDGKKIPPFASVIYHVVVDL